MRMKTGWSWLGRIAVVLVFCACSEALMSAQAPQRTLNLTEILAPGSTVWITEAGGREERVRVVGQSGDIVTVTSSNEARRVRVADVARVRVREADSLVNGALIGAGVAVASGLSLCLAMEPWENCRDD